jgi:site-specific recombinase XerD
LKGSATDETFNDFIDRYIRNINRNKSESEKLSFRTIQTYQTFHLLFNEFRDNVHFDEISPSLVHDFERFLAVEKNQRGVTRSKNFSKLKIIYHHALKEGLAEYDERLLFSDIKIKQEKSDRVSLNQDEIRTIKESELTNSKDEYFKNIFLFQCLCGAYYSDVCKMKVGDIERTTVNENGTPRTFDLITGNRSKNDLPFVVPVLPDSRAILEKHSSWPGGDKDDILFADLISEQKYNKKLKSIAADLKIDKRISNKVARHSFSEMMSSMGVPLSLLQRALGHTQISTTEIYAKMTKASAVKGWIDFKL